MPFHRYIDRARGFSVVDLLAIVATIGILTAIAVPNYQKFRTQSYDTVAHEDFRGLVVQINSTAPDKTPDLVLLEETGPKALPASLSDTRLSHGVQLNYALKLTVGGFFDVKAAELTHPEGQHLYRYCDVNGNQVQQILAKP